jgi:hypothetical protein
VDQGTTSCSPYVCGATTCKASCAGDADCVATHYCLGAACVAKKATGVACAAANECSSGFCVDGVCCGANCAACQSCNQGGSLGTCKNVPNGQEDTSAPNTCTGVSSCDGAGACKKDNGQACAAASECTSGFCVDGTCCNAECPACQACNDPTSLGTCKNVPFNTDDTSAPNQCMGTSTCDGGGSCKKEPGASCAVASECLSANCVDGVCCDLPCTGTCQACSAVKKGQGLDGFCGNIKSGVDPDGECPDGVACRTGLCNGNGACGNSSAGTACGDLQSCVAGLETHADSCNGSGACVDAGTQLCTPYVCDAATSMCIAVCNDDSDCIAGDYCDLAAGDCLPSLAVGQPCTDLYANECLSGSCVDGVCCSSACTTQCFSCNVSAGTAGTCTAIAAGFPEVDPACGAGEACNLLGQCKVANGGACSVGLDCASGVCTSSVCKGSTNQPCAGNGDCASNQCAAGVCKGAGGQPCSIGSECEGGVCTLGLCLGGAGDPCLLNSFCANNTCVDGFCCNMACGAKCQSCNVAGLEGTCSNVPEGFPDTTGATCSGNNACDGTGTGNSHCKKANGQGCGAGSECASGTCTGGTCKGDPGQPCSVGSHCASGTCSGGLCQ